MFLSKICSFLFICMLAFCGNSVSQEKGSNLQSINDEQIQQFALAEQPKTTPELALIMERYTWTHTLSYKVKIQPDGKVVFTKTNGKFVGTKIRGRAESKLEPQKIEQLLTEIGNAGFFSLDSAYGYRFKNCASVLSDSDSVKIHIKLNEQEKTINHDLGCFGVPYAELYREVNRNDRIFPQQLYKLENKIDEIVETERWIGEKR